MITGALNETESCVIKKCPVDGWWMEWQPWSNCSAECGDGARKRKRECVEPLFDGLPCHDKTLEAESCSMDPCAGKENKQDLV